MIAASCLGRCFIFGISCLWCMLTHEHEVRVVRFLRERSSSALACLSSYGLYPNVRKHNVVYIFVCIFKMSLNYRPHWFVDAFAPYVYVYMCVNVSWEPAAVRVQRPNLKSRSLACSQPPLMMFPTTSTRHRQRSAALNHATPVSYTHLTLPTTPYV